jgi:hypothetical protein
MPQFINPFAGVVSQRLKDQGMSNGELIRAMRQNMAAELEAAHLYEAHIDASHNQLVNRVLQDIADEEKMHAGEFLRLIEMLTGNEGIFLKQGADEVDGNYKRLPEPQQQQFTNRAFNILDPLGISDMARHDVARLAAPVIGLITKGKEGYVPGP